ncbi:hypothetical protein [Deinococcus yavapaiensis]|uniref:YCII-related domain-containing protein n=1 Tax=Deinococcus yavapaiensis KR-236 TaxID=694435 RepID=A0A318SDI6_9DEIO|nr:hypothetical protein [Deinococcus yavapaiensis]PYE50458.1 hypothetical protein DES52_11875 [Deinococcus yavapaiensis KR-236]
MRRYIVLYQAPLTVAERFAQATPEEAMKGVQLWRRWMDTLGDALLDPGRPIGNAITLTKSGSVERRSNVVGMSILNASSMEQACQMVSGHHHLDWADECEITVLEEMPIPELEAGK